MVGWSVLSLGLVLASALCLQGALGAHWALLVAGSNGYMNYRHQADICHAYHIMKSHGIPEENIVTLMYDDIAYNEENPYKGNIINRPNGPNVYPGVVIDYKKRDVTPEMFIAVLTGNEAEVKRLTGRDGGKVIKSGPNDHIFVNFADHGGPGLLGFPDEATLKARKLDTAIKQMHADKKYKEMVFYVEACYSGSMFQKLLPKDINVFVTTAANAKESSYAYYFDKKRHTYLGDVYSISWMEDSDKENLNTETLETQYELVKKRTNTSHVMEYGQKSLSQMTVAEFQGNQSDRASILRSTPYMQYSGEAVPQDQAEMNILTHKYQMAATPEDRVRAIYQIEAHVQRNENIDAFFKGIVLEARRARNSANNAMLRFYSEVEYRDLKSERRDITQWDCYEHALDTLKASCPGLRLTQSYHGLRQLFILVNMCERGTPTYVVAEAMQRAAFNHSQLCQRQ